MTVMKRRIIAATVAVLLMLCACDAPVSDDEAKNTDPEYLQSRESYGYDTGRREGYEEGYAEGFDAGFDVGWYKGYHDAMEDAENGKKN